MYVISLNMSIFTCYMFVYMYVHAVTPPACGLSFICNKVLFCSVLIVPNQNYMLSYKKLLSSLFDRHKVL